jgi:hypothetical protein
MMADGESDRRPDVTTRSARHAALEGAWRPACAEASGAVFPP